MKDRILQKLRSGGYRPMNKSQLAKALGVQSGERSQMRSVLNKMDRKGEVIMDKKYRYSLSDGDDTEVSVGRGNSELGDLVGTIRFLDRGSAWFYPDANDTQNKEAGFDPEKYDRVYVDSRDTGVALDGDRVSVRVEEPKQDNTQYNQQQDKRGGKFRGKHKKGGKYRGKKNDAKESKKPWETGPKGVVLSIIKRGESSMVGTYRERGKFKYVEPDFSGFPNTMELVAAENDISGGAKKGQRVVVELISWDNKHAIPVGKIIEVLGWPDDPGVDIVSVMHKHGIRSGFASEVLNEAELITENISEQELERREDWRKELVLTVDPADAKDHDDAILVKPLSPENGGGWELAVHIADVSHYVKPGSELDAEAQKRGNSTYLVDRVLPMLPEKISNGVCSLKPDVDRLTKCAVIKFDAKGNRVSARFCDAVIHSKAKMSYEEAQVLLHSDDHKEGDKVAIQRGLKDAWALASVLRKKRFSDGALDLEFPEVKVVLDENLKAIGIENVVHNESHQMVEECMLAANEAVAVEIKMKRKNAVYRIHENPDFDKLHEFSETARGQGFKVGDLTNKKHIQELLEQAKGSPSEESIKIGLLKSLKRAAYSTDGLGHYGLAKMDYCHFTSPIRRYADLIVHRALQGLLTKPPEKLDHNPKIAELGEIAAHISDTERKSAEAENETKKMKMMEYLYRVVREDKEEVFDAIVTDVRRMGLFVEISAMKIKGLVKVEDLPGREHGRWRMEGMRYRSSNGGEISLGEHVKVEIVKINTERKMVDFKIVEP